MPFETSARPPKRIAVIGGGISGMSAAHFLANGNAVVLFEGAPRLGGHARTVLAGKRADVGRERRLEPRDLRVVGGLRHEGARRGPRVDGREARAEAGNASEVHACLLPLS